MKPRNPSFAYPIITALVAAVPAYFAASAFGMAIGSEDGHYYGVIVSLAVFSGVWCAMRLHMAPVEREDKPKEQPWTKLEVSLDDGMSADWLGLPLNNEQLRTMARYLLDGVSFSDAMRRMGIGRKDAAIARDEMILRGLLRWNNPGARQQGVSLTGKGRATMKGLANGS